MCVRRLVLVGMVAISISAVGLPAVEISFPSGDRQPIGAAANPVALEAADLDGDGDLDLVAGIGSGVAWWENGDGLGGAWTRHEVEDAVYSVDGVDVADLDGDGDLDLVLGASSLAEIRWYENLGGGAAWTGRVVATAFAGVASVTAGDLDGDGDPDLLATAFDDGQVSWWSNDDGLGQSWTGHGIAGGFAGARGAVIADIDGDGDLDAAAAAFSDGRLAWWENQLGGAGGWVEHSLMSSLSGPYDIAAGDIDSDGDLDLMFTTFFDDTVRWLENTDGAGTSWSFRTVTTTLVRARCVELADVNHDGALDAVTTGHVGNVLRLYLNGNDGLSWSPHTFDDDIRGPEEALAADLDGDGDLDLVAGSRYDGWVAWWPNETIHRSALYPEQRGIASSFSQPWSVDAADLDGDGDPDIVVAASGADFVAWFENWVFESGKDAPWDRVVIDDEFDFAAAVRAADMDGDGDPDVVGAALYGDAVTWWENGDGTGGLWLEHPIAVGFDGAFAVEVADMDGDGDLDVVGAALLGDVVTWWENASGDGTTWTPHVVEGALDGAVSVAVGDLDGDGDPDIAAAGCQSDTFEWFENLDGGAGSWDRHVVAGGLDYAHDVALGDLDGDGDLDLIGAAAWADRLLWWENAAGDASAWLQRTVDDAVDGVRGLDLADLDGDGDLDVLAAAAYTSSLSWWENLDGAGSTWVEHTFDGVFVGGTAVRAADLTGDGWLDVVATPLDQSAVVWWESFGGQFALATTGLAPTFARSGETVTMLGVTASHRGRSGDGDAMLRTFQLQIAGSALGAPLTAGEANALIAELTVWRDDGSGAFEPGVDALVTTVAPLAFIDGRLQVELPIADPIVRFGLGAPATHWIVAGLQPDAHLQTPHTVAVKHCTTDEYSSSASHWDHGVGLELERVENVWTGTMVIVDPSAIFVDDFESGDTTAWSTSTP